MPADGKLRHVQQPGLVHQRAGEIAFEAIALERGEAVNFQMAGIVVLDHLREQRDALRRRRPDTVPIDAVAEVHLKIDAVEPVPKLKLPEALLSPRQREILGMLYDGEMEVAEIAVALGIDPQTVRSAHHKAMLKLRAHFKADME